MKAAVYYDNGGPEVLRYEDAPEPMCLADGVVLDVEVIGVHTAGRDPCRRQR
jgi:NADPH:quinone reductase